MKRPISNWSGSVRFTPGDIVRPETEAEIVELIRHTRSHGRKIRLIGSGHSFTPLVETDATLISLEQFQGVETVDAANQLAMVRAGSTIKNLSQSLLEKGWSFENLEDINAQSVAGAISTGTHGTGIHLGILARVQLRVKPLYQLHDVSQPLPLKEVLNNLDAYKENHRQFECYWFPYTDTVQVKFLHPTDLPPSKQGWKSTFNKLVLENGVFWLLSEAARLFSSLSPRVSRIPAESLPTVLEEIKATVGFPFIFPWRSVLSKERTSGSAPPINAIPPSSPSTCIK